MPSSISEKFDFFFRSILKSPHVPNWYRLYHIWYRSTNGYCDSFKKWQKCFECYGNVTFNNKTMFHVFIHFFNLTRKRTSELLRNLTHSWFILININSSHFSSLYRKVSFFLFQRWLSWAVFYSQHALGAGSSRHAIIDRRMSVLFGATVRRCTLELLMRWLL